MTNQIMETIQAYPTNFNEHWLANGEPEHPAITAAIDAMEMQFDPGTPVAPVDIVDVSLRDGLQQRANKTSVADRIEIFDAVVNMGIRRIEIGHLGNEVVDQVFGKHLIGHIARQKQTDPRYEDLQLQVLFNSIPEQMEAGTEVLVEAYRQHYPDTWQAEMAGSTVVHVYDRVDPIVTTMASNPYSIEDSARRITGAAAIAISKGFKQFSISGELATAISPEEATRFFRTINATMFDQGAERINNNLANTYGYSSNHQWNVATLTAFNAAVKFGFEPASVTTSIHAHNDTDDAVAGSMRAIAAGFDMVEGTAFGTGERPGNTKNIDIAARFIEAARHEDIAETRNYRTGRLGQAAGAIAIRRSVKLNQRLVDNLHNWYPEAYKVATILGKHALFRFHTSAVGNPYAHDNGSGPHDQVMAEAIKDPTGRPGDASYEWSLMTNYILGRPGTKEIAIGDPEAVDAVTVGNHAGGRKTAMIKNGELKRPPQDIIDQASQQFEEREARIIGRLATNLTVYA